MAGNVLFVDDDRSILSALQRLFADQDIQICVADSPQEALDVLARKEIAVLVSDHHMPGMTGIELLERAKTLAPETIKILMTAYGDLQTAIDAINRGEVFRFVTKPWDNEAFVAIVREGLDKYTIVQELKKTDEGTLLSLAQTIELKDPYTRGHCDRVARYALDIAEVLNLSEGYRLEIKHGCWLHDCGKIGVPERILNKPGALTSEEMEIIKMHPVWGADVARIARRSEGMINIILHHHERFDGTGYPSRRSGREIPLEARIAAVADVFDALSTNRPYRPAFPFSKALGIFRSMRGSALDPEILDLFLTIIAQSGPQEADNA